MRRTDCHGILSYNATLTGQVLEPEGDPEDSNREPDLDSIFTPLETNWTDGGHWGPPWCPLCLVYDFQIPP